MLPFLNVLLSGDATSIDARQYVLQERLPPRLLHYEQQNQKSYVTFTYICNSLFALVLAVFNAKICRDLNSQSNHSKMFSMRASFGVQKSVAALDLAPPFSNIRVDNK